jgi:hypothetical protein
LGDSVWLEESGGCNALARRLGTLGVFVAVAQTHIAALADKCNEGTLSAAERAEYETFVHALYLISVLQAKARRWLTRQAVSWQP